ncbi:GNAT family N-acetyltransferase [Undibacterium squillarum]|uniref:N-acetyltransferase domain-containing protein n=1 Tax=Undibacterium squillarum TaxID=1131567 RepID=A0ABQ2XYN6_9BURK|nr:GNAT family N-acetyltransferase [Undibacterium squillarum]GGX41982.1 hypothetical protein GCM10010946_20630 [Undibacterium squillarum]
MRAVNVKWMTSEADLRGLEAGWRALESRVPGLLPFQTYDWNVCWWRHFARNTVWIKDHLLIAAVYDQEMLVAVMPLMNTQIGHSDFHIYRNIRPFGADPNLTELRVPLVDPAYTEALALVWDQLAEHETFGLTEFQMVLPDALSAATLEHTPHLHLLSQRAIPNFIVELGDDWEQFRSGLKRNIKESLRRCYNSLKRDELSHRLEVLRGEQIMAVLPRFYSLHGMRASAEDTIAHPDYFCIERHRRLIEDMIASGSAQRCCMLVLYVGEQAVAMRLAFAMPDELYLYYSGYDLDYGRYSVMTTLVAETMKWAIEQGCRRVNLSIGEDVSKTRWGPLEVRYQEVQCVGNAGWRIALVRGMNAIRSVRRKIRAKGLQNNEILPVA